MPAYEEIFATACERKGGAANLKKLLPKPVSMAKLKMLPDDRYLAEFCKKIFQSGFVWRVVENKWENFEELFWQFNVDKLLLMPDDMLERKAQDPRIIRNHRKVLAIRENAAMIAATTRQNQCSFGEFVAKWPRTDTVGLWLYLKQNGSRLGGNTGPYALRNLGVDTFLLTRDVEGYLRNRGIIDSGPGTKRALNSAQEFFNQLRDDSGRSLSELSRLISFCFGENRAGVMGP